MEIFKTYALQIIIALITSALIPSVVTIFANRHKVKAEAADTITGSALELMDGIKDELKRLREKVLALEDDVSKKECRIRTLEDQLAEKDLRITELQAAVISKDYRIDALEKRIRELEEVEKRNEQTKRTTDEEDSE